MKASRIFKAIGGSIMAVVRGEFLLRIRFDKYFPHILYTFLLLWLTIWIGLKAENTLVRVEKNRKTIDDLEKIIRKKNWDATKIERLTTVETLISRTGADVAFPTRPADRITDKNGSKR